MTSLVKIRKSWIQNGTNIGVVLTPVLHPVPRRLGNLTFNLKGSKNQYDRFEQTRTLSRTSRIPLKSPLSISSFLSTVGKWWGEQTRYIVSSQWSLEGIERSIWFDPCLFMLG